MGENGKQNFTPLYLFFGAIMALIVLPKLLMTLMMLGTGKALSAFQSGFCHYIGYIVGGALFYVALSVNRKPLKAVKDILSGGLSLLVIRQLSFILHNFGPLASAGTEPAALAADIVLLIFEALIFSYLLFAWVLAIRDEKDRFESRKRFSQAFRGVSQILLCAAVYAALNFGCGFLTDTFITGMGKSRSVTAFIAKMIIIALIVFAAMYPTVLLMRKKADRLVAGDEAKAPQTPADPVVSAPENAVQDETAVPGTAAPENTLPEAKKPFLISEFIGVAELLLALIVLYVVPLFFTPDRSGAVIDSFGQGMSESFNYAAKRDYLMALDSLDKALSLPDAWEAYLYGDPEDALEAYELNRDLPMTELLYYYTCAENPELTDDPDQISIDLTDALRSHRGDEVWYFGYLDILSKKDGLTEDEKREKNRVIMELAAGNRFNCPAVLPSELTGPERDKITDNFGGYDIIADRYDDTIAVWKILVQYAEKNGIDEEMSKAILELAVEYPGSDPVRQLVYTVIDECLQTTNGSQRWMKFSRYFANDTVLGLIDEAAADQRSFAKNELAIRAAQRFIVNYNSDNDVFRGDRDSVREKIYPVILNFDKLCVRELKRDYALSENEKTEARVVGILDMARVMTDMDMSEELQEYLENVSKTVEDVRIEEMLGAAALKNGDYTTALPLMEKEYENNKDDLELTMELAILYVRTDKITKSLEKAVSFTEGMLAPGVLEENPQLGTDFTALIATYVTGDKSLSKRIGKECLYESFTDEQKEIVKRSKLLNDMLDCEYRYQFKLLGYLMEAGGEENYRKLEEDALKLTEDYPLLSTGYYLAGRIVGHYAREFRDDEAGRKAQKELIDLDRAIELYVKCLGFEDDQPAVAYSLALTLDHVGRYEEALEVCNALMDHMYRDAWYTDWGQDYHGWGVFGHTRNLMESLKGKLAQAG